MYLGFAETQQDTPTFWTAQAYHRLRRIKAAVDPEDQGGADNYRAGDLLFRRRANSAVADWSGRVHPHQRFRNLANPSPAARGPGHERSPGPAA
jgi:hypothetical protein